MPCLPLKAVHALVWLRLEPHVLAAWFGHSTITVTRNIYSHIHDEDPKDCAVRARTANYPVNHREHTVAIPSSRLANLRKWCSSVSLGQVFTQVATVLGV